MEIAEQPDKNVSKDSSKIEKKSIKNTQAADPIKEIARISERFLLQLDALVETASRVMPTLLKNEQNAKKEHADFRVVFGALPKDLAADSWYTEFRKLDALANARIKAIEARRMLPSSFLVSMVGLYDTYFSNIVRQLFILRPEKIRAGEKSISIQQIVKHESIDDLLNEVVSDELEDVLRGSHLEQLEWMTKKFDFTIDTNLVLVHKFTELTERRNICVHSDSCVSKQYVEKCKKLPKEIVADRKVGEWVPIGYKYLRMTRDVLFEIGCRILQGAWRKARRDQSEEQNEMLIELGFELLNREDYVLAKNIYSFALEIRNLSDLDKRVISINKAIAMKFTGQADDAISLLDQLDWSAAEGRFKLAVAVLKDEYERALRLMINIPETGEGSISKTDYREWPLFKEIREKDTFAKAFEEKFREPLITKSESIDSRFETNEQEAAGEIETSDELVGERNV